MLHSAPTLPLINVALRGTVVAESTNTHAPVTYTQHNFERKSFWTYHTFEIQRKRSSRWIERKLCATIFRFVLRALIIFPLITAWNIGVTFFCVCGGGSQSARTRPLWCSVDIASERWLVLFEQRHRVVTVTYLGWLCCRGAVPMVRSPPPPFSPPHPSPLPTPKPDGTMNQIVRVITLGISRQPLMNFIRREVKIKKRRNVCCVILVINYFFRDASAGMTGLFFSSFCLV